MGRAGSIVGALVMILGACAGSEEELSATLPPGNVCNPGTESECTCMAGLSGRMLCSSNGQSFGECVCEVEAGLR
jgi:hypothetical protein